jgi:hypothetical protein
VAERSDRFAVTLALLVAGGTGVVLGGLVGMGASNTERADRVRAAAMAQNAAGATTPPVS